MADVQQMGVQIDEIFHRLTTDNSSEDNDILDKIQSLLSVLKTLTQEAASLPVKILEELKLLGCSSWNMTVRHCGQKEDSKERTIKACLRDLATRAFLLGNFAYSGNDVSYEYFSHHPREAEQCVLMCLKTSRDLSLCGMGTSSKELLQIGANVGSYIQAGMRNSLTHLKHRNMNWEFAYTMMDVTWNLQQYQEASAASEKTIQMLTKENGLQQEHCEAFFRFVFTTANANNIAPNNECYLRDLLTGSITVQEHFSEELAKSHTVCHLQTLRGVTFQQIAMSWLRESNAKEALRWANEADMILKSTDSAMLRLRTTAQTGDFSKADLLLLEYAQRTDVTVDEVVAACFEMQRIFRELNLQASGPKDVMAVLYQKTKGTSSAEHVLFRYVQLLLIDGLIQSQKLVLQLLQDDGLSIQNPKYRRYSFMWLWELSDSNELAEMCIIQCLETTLQFKDTASDVEINAITLRLCSEYITLCEEGKKDPTESLIRATTLLQNCVERSQNCVFAHCLLFKVAVLKQNEHDVEHELNCICVSEPSDLVQAALCTIINYSIKQNYVRGLSLAASRAVFWSGSSTNILTELELLRVYVASLLSKVCLCTDEEMHMVATKFYRILSDNVATVRFSQSEATWWSQVFLTLGSEFVEGCPSKTSITLFRAATFASQQGPICELLRASLLCTLEDEFYLFVNGHPYLDLETLDEQLDLCKESLSTQYSIEGRVTFLLSTAERHLRRPTENTQEIIDNILKELSDVAATCEDYSRLAEAASYAFSVSGHEHPYLQLVAMKLHLHSVAVLISGASLLPSDENNSEGTVDLITSVLSSLYEAFTLAYDRGQQLLVTEKLIDFLALPISTDVKIESFIVAFCPTGVLSAISHKMSFAILILEFFTVELWNNAVFYLHLADTLNQEKWMGMTWTLLNVLPQNNGVGITLNALKATMSF